MSNKGDKLKERLASFVSTQTEKPSKKELEAAIKTVFNDIKRTGKAEKDDSNVEKQKRKPSAYNLFYSEQSLILKKKEENGEEKMSAKAKMIYISGLWNQKTGKEPEPEKLDLEDE